MWSSLTSSSGHDRETLLEFVEVTLNVDELRLGGGGLIDGLAKLGPAGQTLAVPGDVLACHQHAHVLAVKIVQTMQVLQEDAAYLSPTVGSVISSPCAR